MVKQRKERLGGEFIGFGAFAAPSSSQDASTTSAAAVTWAPVYMGTSAEFRSLFQRVAQKRDRTTLLKAITELQTLFQSTDVPKKVQAEALQHWAWLYHTKVGPTESNASVRAASFQTWVVATERLPKAASHLVATYPELLGMLRLAATDPSTEVRTVATNSTSLLQRHPTWPWQPGFFEYTTRILSYGRPSTMDESLFPQQSGEPDREAMEERFHRLVGNCLDALTQWVRTEKGLDDENAARGVWWKYLTSPKPALRLQSYHLLSAVASQPSMKMACTLRQRLPELVAAEKDPGTVVDLLETVLAVLVHADRSSSTAADVYDPTLLVKAVSKLFRKGCHRAPADRWGPIVLPLVVKLNKSIDILKAVQDGIPNLLSDSDKWSAWTAVCETALLCDEPLLWKDGLEVALTQTDSHRSAATARSKCFRGLAQQVATNDSLDVSSFLLCPGAILTKFVTELLRLQTTTPRRVIPELQQRGLIIIKHARATPTTTPSLADYELLYQLVQYLGPLGLFSTEVALSSFVTEELARWSRLHATSDSSNLLLTKNFQLLSACFFETNVQTLCWEPFLRNLLSGPCRLVSLAEGLEIVRQGRRNADWILCDALDEHSLQLGRESTAAESVSPSEEYADQLFFFSVCLGKQDQSPLLRATALSKLVRMGSSDSSVQGSSLLEALLLWCERSQTFVNDSLQQIILGSWRCVHSSLFDEHGKALITEHLRTDFITMAAHELREGIAKISAGPDVELLWIERACVLLEFVDDCGSTIPLLGLESMEMWQRDTVAMFHVLILLFDSWGTSSSHWAMVQTWFTDDGDFTTGFIDFLLLLSEAGISTALNFKVMKRKDRCNRCLQAVGAGAIGDGRIEELVTAVLRRMSLVQVDGSELEKLLSVFSQLLHFLFPPLISSTDLCLKAESVREGDEVYYLTDANQPESFVPARVAKVHYDAQAGYYFTLHVSDGSGEVNERQTVLGRLRRKEYSTVAKTCRFQENVSAEELSTRKRVLDYIMTEVIMAHQSKIATSLALSELLAVAVGHVGLGSSRGIGTAHYDLRRCIVEIETKARSLLQEGDISGFEVCLSTLSLSLGFGRIAPETATPIIEMKIDPAPLTEMILTDDLLKQERIPPALASWFVVCLRLLEASQQDRLAAFQKECLTALFSLSSALFSAHQKDASTEHIIGSRALAQGVSSIAFLNCDDDAEIESHGQEALAHFVDAFLANSTTESDNVVTSLDAEDINLFVSSICATKTTRLLDGKAERLCNAFFDPDKRAYCFMMMAAVASRKKRLYGTESVRLADSTSEHLKEWQSGLEEDEATELEEDIYVVAEWIPVRIMSELESWSDGSLEDLGSDELVGRFLTWLIFLDLVEAATPTEFRIRPAFVSYLERCDGINELLNLCVVYSETVGHNTKQRFQGVLESNIDVESVADIDKLATLSLFRAVELFPSLTKRWWEEDCPKSSVNLVQSFVEQNITLEILRRELRRMKTSTSFGAMTVSGSTVSREVVATYQQDDFNLKAVVSIPPCFPLRSAEVDCSKTLGVPAKRWKMWSLQIRLMLNNQGGTLQDALMLWKNNVDREFEGVEPCPVCYSVLHVKTHKLPSLECTTCHNRFHFDCLTQWFRSSGKNQCVLCQQQWQGTRI